MTPAAIQMASAPIAGVIDPVVTEGFLRLEVLTTPTKFDNLQSGNPHNFAFAGAEANGSPVTLAKTPRSCSTGSPKLESKNSPGGRRVPIFQELCGFLSPDECLRQLTASIDAGTLSSEALARSSEVSWRARKIELLIPKLPDLLKSDLFLKQANFSDASYRPDDRMHARELRRLMMEKLAADMTGATREKLWRDLLALEGAPPVMALELLAKSMPQSERSKLLEIATRSASLPVDALALSGALQQRVREIRALTSPMTLDELQVVISAAKRMLGSVTEDIREAELRTQSLFALYGALRIGFPEAFRNEKVALLDPATVPATEEERTIALDMRATAIETIYRLMSEREQQNEAHTLREPVIEGENMKNEKALRDMASDSLRRVMGDVQWDQLNSEVADRTDRKAN